MPKIKTTPHPKLEAPAGFKTKKDGSHVIRIEGKTHSLKSHHLQEAWLEGWGLKLALNFESAPIDTTTFASAADGWLRDTDGLADNTILNRRSAMIFWKDIFGNTPLADIGKDKINRALASATKSPSTIKQYFVILRSFYRELLTAKKITTDPTARIKPPHAPIPKRRSIDTDDHIRLIQAARDLNFTGIERALHLACLFAMRKNDILKLQWLNIKDGALSYTQQKTGEEVYVEFDDITARLIDTWQAGDLMHRICTRQSGTPYRPYEFNYDLSKVARQAGLGHICIKDYRSGTSQSLVDDGASLEEVAGLTGHRSVNTLKKFYTNDSIGKARRMSHAERFGY